MDTITLYICHHSFKQADEKNPSLSALRLYLSPDFRRYLVRNKGLYEIRDRDTTLLKEVLLYKAVDEFNRMEGNKSLEVKCQEGCK